MKFRLFQPKVALAFKKCICLPWLMYLGKCRGLKYIIMERFRATFAANVNLYHVTKFHLFLSFTVHYVCTNISSFTPVLSKRIVLGSFYLLIFFLEEFLTSLCTEPPPLLRSGKEGRGVSTQAFLNFNLTFAVCRNRYSKSL